MIHFDFRREFCKNPGIRVARHDKDIWNNDADNHFWKLGDLYLVTRCGNCPTCKEIEKNGNDEQSFYYFIGLNEKWNKLAFKGSYREIEKELKKL